MVKLKRKELEVVRVGRQLKSKEEQVARTLRDAELRSKHLEATRAEIEATLRREWEVKARLEIDRQVQVEKQKLFQDFEAEVNQRLALERSREFETRPERIPVRSLTPDVDGLPQDTRLGEYHQSQSTTGETDDFPSSTDLSELSLESPTLKRSLPKTKTGRTPFGRAQTMFEGSPVDVLMADPSPAPIGPLGLSPRRKEKKPSQLRNGNIFAAAMPGKPGWGPQFSSSLEESEEEPVNMEDDDDDTDEVPALPSPSHNKGSQF